MWNVEFKVWLSYLEIKFSRGLTNPCARVRGENILISAGTPTKLRQGYPPNFGGGTH
jgi:hypothetical protein